MNVVILLLVLAIVVAALVVQRYAKRSKHEADWPPELVAKVKAQREARENIKAENPELFQAISPSLLRADPFGIYFGNNTDEYEPEAGTIIPRLPSCTSEEDVLQVVHQEFCQWFGDDTAGSKDKYRAVSKEIWEVWNKLKTQPPHAPGSD
jgi:hypothetical protein